MTVLEFKRHCEQKNPKIIIYNDENDKERTAKGGQTSHYEALKMILIFDSVNTIYPNTIYFKSDCGTMYIHNVKCVTVESGCMLGEIATISAGASNGLRQYTFIIQ